jgi:cbb3-type cytochrome oxidase maturation protein
MDITFYLFFVAFLISLAAWCIFLWAIRTGQFQNVEDIKYQVWPAAEELSGDSERAVGAATGSIPSEDGRRAV